MKKIATYLITASTLLIFSPMTNAWNGGGDGFGNSESPSEDPTKSPFKSSYIPTQEPFGEVFKNTIEIKKVTVINKDSELLNFNASDHVG